MFGAFQVAAHPIETVRDPGKHRVFSLPVHLVPIALGVIMPAAPTYPYCRRLATNSPRAIHASAPRGLVRPAPASHSRHTKCKDANLRGAPALRLRGNRARATDSESAAQCSFAARPEF